MTTRIYAIIALLLVLIGLASILWWRAKPPTTDSFQHEKRGVTGKAGNDTSRERFPLRYAPENDPAHSKEAADAYHARREALIRGFHGDAQIDRVMENLRNGNNLPRWISMAQEQELVQAIPLIAGMLNHEDEVVRRVAVRALCEFGDKRGFDYVLDKMEGTDSQEWWSIFEKDVASEAPREYLPRIKALLSKKDASPVEVHLVAKALAGFGDPDSAQYLVPVVESAPERHIETILKLGNVDDPSVTALAKKLSAEGPTTRVKHAADVVLAKRGDSTAQQRLIDAARRVIALPQPQNADGTYKPGLRQQFIDQPTPAWDGDAFFALEYGMEAVAPAQAVPVLQDIAINADNVRFSATAIKLLAKVGDEAARSALWHVAASAKEKRRTFEDTLFTTIGKALTLFDDKTSTELARSMFGSDKHTMEVSEFLARTRGWDGLFEMKLFY
jgi:HEAT repeat protein